jgi:hypothetical protein
MPLRDFGRPTFRSFTQNCKGDPAVGYMTLKKVVEAVGLTVVEVSTDF